jgi:O-antigen/teichoic acid export membrane protein
MLVARGLGAARYGEYQFLLASVAALSQFVDLGTSQAFFTFIARGRRHARFFGFYFAWLALQFVLIAVMVGLILPTRTLSVLWVGEDRAAILLAVVATFLMNELWEAVSQLGEARRRTVIVQGALVAQAAIHLALVATAAYLGRLTVALAFGFIIVEYGILVVLLAARFVRESIDLTPRAETFSSTAAEFWTYCRPLILYALSGFAFGFLDRWLLQRFGGSVQQGFFAVGQQLATISLLATTSIMQVFWTEIAAASGANDHERLIRLYRSTSRALYFVAAWVSCLLLPYSREILSLTVGSSYVGATASFALMLLFPIHQSLGRINGSFLQAVGDTSEYARIGVAVLAVSLPISYLLLVPRTATIPGLGLGAIGLTIKLIVVNVLSVNLLSYRIARRMHVAYDWRYQVVSIAALLAVGFACRALAYGLLGSEATFSMQRMAAAVTAYAAVTAALIYAMPVIVGLTASDIADLGRVCRTVIRVG